MISPQFLEMLRCPADKSRLALADAVLVSRLNEAVAAGTLCNVAGRTVTRRLDGVLVREDRAIAYPIIDELPILLIDEGIAITEFARG